MVDTESKASSETQSTENTENSAGVAEVETENKPERPFFRRTLRKKKQCFFCVDKITKIDYKEGMRLRKYISERAKILPRRATGMCAYHQRVLATSIKRARILALIPCTNTKN